jgi:HK97 family phage portal protein
MTPLFHPLVGVTPIYACGSAALQGISISNKSQMFFSNGSNPSGFLTAPGAISQDTANRLKTYFETNFYGDNIGKVAVGGDGLKYEPFSMSAVDSQLIEQLHWTAETVCSCFHVPPYMVGIGAPPPYANIEPLLQQYFAQAIQTLMVSMETCLDEGLGLGPQFGNTYGVEFNIDDLIWMDTATRTKAAGDSVSSGVLSPNESRKKYHGYGPVEGGDSPMMQQQNFSLQALAERDATDPFPKDPPAAAAPPRREDDTDEKALAKSALRQKRQRLLNVAA